MIGVFAIFGIVSLVTYAIVCLRERNYINAVTPYFAFYFASSFVFEPIFFATSGYSYNVGAFTFIYTCNLSYFSAYAMVFTVTAKSGQPRTTVRMSSTDSRLGHLCWLLLGISMLLFVPVAMQFRALLLDPRAVYAQTRVGFGQFFFVSALFLNLSVICFLFSRRRAAIPFFVGVLILSAVKGAKGPILVILEIAAMWAVYIRGWHVGLTKFAISIGALLLLIGGLFAVTLRGVEIPQLLEGIAGYSDYNRNAALTVTDPVGPLYGKLALENYFYSRIPRVLDPDKPKDFGAFYLAEHYFPDRFESESGAPAFGAGVYIADFGLGTPLVMLLLGAASGYILALCLRWLRRGGGVAAFITMLYFADVSLIPVPMAFLGVEHLLLGLLIRRIGRLRLSASGSMGGGTTTVAQVS